MNWREALKALCFVICVLAATRCLQIERLNSAEPGDAPDVQPLEPPVGLVFETGGRMDSSAFDSTGKSLV